LRLLLGDKKKGKGGWFKRVQGMGEQGIEIKVVAVQTMYDEPQGYKIVKF